MGFGKKKKKKILHSDCYTNCLMFERDNNQNKVEETWKNVKGIEIFTLSM